MWNSGRGYAVGLRPLMMMTLALPPCRMQTCCTNSADLVQWVHSVHRVHRGRPAVRALQTPQRCQSLDHLSANMLCHVQCNAVGLFVMRVRTARRARICSMPACVCSQRLTKTSSFRACAFACCDVRAGRPPCFRTCCPGRAPGRSDRSQESTACRQQSRGRRCAPLGTRR